MCLQSTAAMNLYMKSHSVVQNVDDRGGGGFGSEVVGEDVVQAAHSNLLRFSGHVLVVQTVDEGSDVVCTAHLLLHDKRETATRNGIVGILLRQNKQRFNAALRIFAYLGSYALIRRENSAPFFFTSFAKLRKSISMIPE